MKVQLQKLKNKILSDYYDRFCYESEFKKDLKKIHQYSLLIVIKMLLNHSKNTNVKYLIDLPALGWNFIHRLTKNAKIDNEGDWTLKQKDHKRYERKAGENLIQYLHLVG